MTAPRSSRDKHSFIQFYFDDWSAGTSRMARPVRSVYFDICLYTWDKRRPVTPAALSLMLSDLGEQGNAIVDALVEEGSLIRSADGAVHSPRALAEAGRAYDAWEAKSRGGRGKRNGEESEKTDAAKLEESSQDSSTEPEPEPEPEDSANAESVDATPSDKIPSRPAMQMVVDKWNDMAGANDLSQISKMSEARIERLKARIVDHGVNLLLERIAMIPQSSFLMGKTKEGWKAHFDWLVQASTCLRLVEGFYHNQGKGKGSAWTQ